MLSRCANDTVFVTNSDDSLQDHHTVATFGRAFFFEKKGKNTLINFGKGDTALFLNMKPNQIELEP